MVPMWYPARFRSPSGQHHSPSNVLFLLLYCCPSTLHRVRTLLNDKHKRYKKSLNNLAPADMYYGRGTSLLRMRRKIKQQTLNKRRLVLPRFRGRFWAWGLNNS